MILYMGKQKFSTMNTEEYKRRLENTKIFADALFKGKIKLLHKVSNKKVIDVYIPVKNKKA